MNFKNRIMDIWNTIRYIRYKIKCILSKAIKTTHDYAQWLIFIEAISLIPVLLISFLIIVAREGITGLSFEEVVYRITCKGEVIFVCIPLLIGLFLELYVRKIRTVFVFLAFTLFLVAYSLSFPVFLLSEPIQTNSALIYVYVPLAILNLSAITVIALPDAAG